MLRPAGINPPPHHRADRGVVQLVASQRGVAALPFWAVKPYLERGYVQALPIGDTACAASYTPPPAPTTPGWLI